MDKSKLHIVDDIPSVMGMNSVDELALAMDYVTSEIIRQHGSEHGKLRSVNRLSDALGVLGSGLKLPEKVIEFVQSIEDGIGRLSYDNFDADNVQSIEDDVRDFHDAIKKWRQGGENGE